MELENWSLSTIDCLFSTRNSGVEEPTCPNGTFSVGYNLDYHKDIYKIELVIAGMLLLGTGMLVYWKKTCLTGAIEGAPRLPDMEMDLNKAVAGVEMGMN